MHECIGCRPVKNTSFSFNLSEAAAAAMIERATPHEGSVGRGGEGDGPG